MRHTAFLVQSLLAASALGADYDYSQNGANWEGVCAEGTMQSPVVIPYPLGTADSATLLSIKDDQDIEAEFIKPSGSKAQKFSVEWTPTEIHVRADDMKTRHTLTMDGTELVLDHVHFHAGAEHPLSTQESNTTFGIRDAGEAHFVYVTNDDAATPKAVLGYIIGTSAEAAEDNQFLKTLGFLDEAKFDTTKESGSYTIDVTLPDGGIHSLFRQSEWNASKTGTLPVLTYAGSLTTPPCTEGIQHFVHRTVVHSDYAKIFARMSAEPGTWRAAQPLNGRAISVVGLRTQAKSGAAAMLGAVSGITIMAVLF